VANLFAVILTVQNVHLPPPINRGGFHALSTKKSEAKVEKKNQHLFLALSVSVALSFTPL
jgi:hypothetical protein